MDQAATTSPFSSQFGKPWIASCISGIALWIAMPYCSVWLLAYVALIPWIGLILRAETGKKFLRQVWIGSYLHWLIVCWFATRPHWAGYIGWVFMAGYLSIYYLLFISISRKLCQRFSRLSLFWIPSVWVSLEWLRGHVFTGFSLASLSHTQYQIPVMIQVSDLFGAYTLSFVIVFSSCAGYLAFQSISARKRLALIFAAISPIALVLGYGFYKLGNLQPAADADPLKLALIQGSVDTVFPWTRQKEEESILQYRDLTIDAIRNHPEVDLVVWPESAYPMPFEPGRIENGQSEYEFQFQANFAAFMGVSPMVIDRPGQQYLSSRYPLLTGIATLTSESQASYNSVVLINRRGEVLDAYHKNHRVMFGEYLPFGEWFPQLYELAPIPRGIASGTEFSLMEFKGYNICPSICFESTVPHLIRHQIDQLENNGEQVDLLANITNDGWFWGSNLLDLHLASNVFRSVENRKPGIVVSNTGFSAYIDGNGNIVSQGGRRKPEYLIVDIKKDGRSAVYRSVGDWPVFGLSILIGLSLVYCLVESRIRNRQPTTQTSP